MQDETIRTLEGGNLAELVELQVLGAGGGRVSLDDIELEVVGLRHGEDGRGAGVGLWRGSNVPSVIEIHEDVH